MLEDATQFVFSVCELIGCVANQILERATDRISLDCWGNKQIEHPTVSCTFCSPGLSSKALWFAATSQKCSRINMLTTHDCLQAMCQLSSGSGWFRELEKYMIWF